MQFKSTTCQSHPAPALAMRTVTYCTEIKGTPTCRIGQDAVHELAAPPARRPPTVWITLVYAFGTLLLSSTHVGGRVGRCNLLPGLRETCMGDGILGVPWWVLVILVVAAVAGTMGGRSMGRAKAHRKAVEKMAEAADAEHEGAKTRHEGGP